MIVESRRPAALNSRGQKTTADLPPALRIALKSHFQRDLLAISENGDLDGVSLLLPTEDRHVVADVSDLLAGHFDNAIALAETGFRGRAARGDAVEQQALFVVVVSGAYPQCRALHAG